tara:strand:- start:1283 stop:1780 length:498 start_codon:yes stop_codon:yes gene_type:complete
MSKSTEILNEILQKLSLLTKEDELAQGVEELDVVAEELSTEEEEAPAEQEAPAEEASEELSEEAVEAEEETQLMEGYVTEEAFASKMAEMEAKMAEMAKMLDEEMGYKQKSEELSSQLEKLSEQPAAEAIEHTPEAATEKKPVYNFGMQRPQNTLDRVFNRLTNK